MTEQELISRVQIKPKNLEVKITTEFKVELRKACKFFNFNYKKLGEKLGYNQHSFNNMLNIGKPIKPFMTELIKIYYDESKKK